jgi:hypothetical protein
MEKPAFTDEQRAYFREAAARRRRVERNCAVCGVPMGVVILKRRYCGPTCRKRAQLQRQRRRTEQAGA